MIANIGVLASALAIAGAGGIPTGLVWGTALVWVTVALLLASLVGVVAQTGRAPLLRHPAAPRVGRRLQLCTCAG